MSRYKYTKLRNLGPVNGFVIHTPDDRKLKDTHPQTIVRELNRLNDRINQLETEKEATNDMFKKLNIHALNLAARIKELEEANTEIRRLKQVIKRKQKALLCVIPPCKHLHHEKGHGHKKSEPCPVVNIVYDGIIQNACDL